LDGGDVGNDDHVFTRDGATVVIDSVSLELVQGAVLDYVEDMAASMFVLKNPNATSSCGCGNSFSL
jgi:iron-sulfur cluster insertion protein